MKKPRSVYVLAARAALATMLGMFFLGAVVQHVFTLLVEYLKENYPVVSQFVGGAAVGGAIGFLLRVISRSVRESKSS